MNQCEKRQSQLPWETAALLCFSHLISPPALKSRSLQQWPWECRSLSGLLASCGWGAWDTWRASNSHELKPKASCSASQMSPSKHTTHTNTEHTGWGSCRVIKKIFASLSLLSTSPLSKVEAHRVFFKKSAAFGAQEQLAKMASFRYLGAEAIIRELNWHF